MNEDDMNNLDGSDDDDSGTLHPRNEQVAAADGVGAGGGNVPEVNMGGNGGGGAVVQVQAPPVAQVQVQGPAAAQGWPGSWGGALSEKSKLADLFLSFGASPDAAIALVNQGLNSIHRFTFASDKMIEDIAYLVRKPGGTRHDVGTTLNWEVVNNMKNFRRYVYLMVTIARPIELTLVSEQYLLQFQNQWMMEDNHDVTWSPSDKFMKFATLTRPRKFFDALVNAMMTYRLKSSGTLMSTMLRPNAFPLSHSADPSSNHSTFDSEMVSRQVFYLKKSGLPSSASDYQKDSVNLKELDFMLKASMKAEVTAADNILFEVLRRMIGDTPEWQHTKPGWRERRGRFAFLTVQSLVTGKAYVQSQINDVKKAIDKVKYSGESSNWSLKQYLSKLSGLFSAADALKEDGHWVGIDANDKVQYVLQGITTPTLDIPKSLILADPAKNADVNLCMQALLQFFESTPSLHVHHQPKPKAKLSEVGVGRGGRGGRDKNVSGPPSEQEIANAKNSVMKYFKGTSCFVPGKEYSKFSKAQKCAHYALKKEWEESGKTTTFNPSPPTFQLNSQAQAVATSFVQAIMSNGGQKRSLSALSLAEAGDEDSDVETEKTVSFDNSTNPALTRPPGSYGRQLKKSKKGG